MINNSFSSFLNNINQNPNEQFNNIINNSNNRVSKLFLIYFI